MIINNKPTCLNGQITFSRRSDDKYIIEIKDKDSILSIMEIQMSANELASFIGGLGATPCLINYYPNDYIGKVYENSSFTFAIPRSANELSRKELEQICIEELERTHPGEGWVPDLSFSSQGSFPTPKRDGQFVAKTVIRRWVDK